MALSYWDSCVNYRGDGDALIGAFSQDGNFYNLTSLAWLLESA